MKQKSVIVWLVVGIVSGLSFFAVTENASAGVTVDAMAEVYGSYFYGNYDLEWTSYDCIEVRLYFEGVQKDVQDEGCHGSGYSTWWWVFSEITAAGQFLLQVWSYWDDMSLYEETWNVPGLSIQSNINPTSGEIGSTFVATSTLQLATGGPDYYSSYGIFNHSIDGVGQEFEAYVIIANDQYWAFYGYPSSKPAFYSYTASTTMSFGSEGQHTVGFKYEDKMTGVIIDGGSETVQVADQYSSLIVNLQNDIQNLMTQLTSLQQELSLLELNVSVLQNDIQNLMAQLTSLQQDLSLLELNISILQEGLDLVEENVSQLQTDVNNLQSTLNTVQTDLGNVIDDLGDLTSRVDDLENRIEDLEASIAGLEEKQTSTTSSLGTNNLLTYLALAFGIVGLVVGSLAALRKRPIHAQPTQPEQLGGERPPEQPPQYPPEP